MVLWWPANPCPRYIYGFAASIWGETLSRCRRNPPPPSQFLAVGDSNPPPYSTIWRGMWSSGRRSGGSDDPERQRCVKANGRRRRATQKYMNRGLEPSPSLLRRETEGYDRRQARLSADAGSSDGGSISRTPLLMPLKRESEELFALRTV